MRKLDLPKEAIKFLASVERKHAGQIALKLLGLMHDPVPADSQRLKGVLAEYFRADVGEYRIIYAVVADEVRVLAIGHRNDADVYKVAVRKV